MSCSHRLYENWLKMMKGKINYHQETAWKDSHNLYLFQKNVDLDLNKSKDNKLNVKAIPEQQIKILSIDFIDHLSRISHQIFLFHFNQTSFSHN